MKGFLFTEFLFGKTTRGEKDQTRRAGKALEVINENPDDWELYHEDKFGFYFENKKYGYTVFVKSRYKVGEVVYLKEPWGIWGRSHLVYKYGNKLDVVDNDGGHILLGEDQNVKWHNKLFMGVDRARYFIKFTGLRVERLFDISDEDCLREGVEAVHTTTGAKLYMDYLGKKVSFVWGNDDKVVSFPAKDGRFLVVQRFLTPQESYFSLFRFANGYPAKKQIKNLWVFVYDYKLCDKDGNLINAGYAHPRNS